jgi:hypothetical protein
MRLLPRSAKGTWLLAAAAWPAACAAAWAAFSTVPRAAWELPEQAHVLAFSPAGDEVYTLAWDLAGGKKGDYRGPLRAWDTRTGRQIRAVLSAADRFNVEDWGNKSQLSHDGRWLALVSPDRPDGVRLVEVATGRIINLPVSGVHIVFPHNWRFSADGRWFAYPEESGIRVWDLKRNWNHAFLDPAYEPFDISPDGTQLVSFVGEDPVNATGVGVWDLVTAKHVRYLENPNFPYSNFGYFLTYSPDGKAIVKVSNSDVGPASAAVVWRWAADSGNRLSAVPPLSDVFVLPNGQVVGTLGTGLGWSQLHLSGTDVQLRPAVPINRDDIVTKTPWCPSGRVAAVWPTQWPAPGMATTLAGWASQHRLGWLFPFPKWRVNFYDATSGREIGPLSLPNGPGFKWAPDGSLIACTLALGEGVQIWDIPPRKPTGRFALAAAVLALSFAALAGRQSRRLRPKTA